MNRLFYMTYNMSDRYIDEIENDNGYHTLVNKYSNDLAVAPIQYFENIPIITIENVSILLNTSYDSVDYAFNQAIFDYHILFNGIDYFDLNSLLRNGNYQYFNPYDNNIYIIKHYNTNNNSILKFDTLKKIVLSDSGLSKLLPLINSKYKNIINKSIHLSGNQNLLNYYNNIESDNNDDKLEVMAYKCR